MRLRHLIVQWINCHKKSLAMKDALKVAPTMSMQIHKSNKYMMKRLIKRNKNLNKSFLQNLTAEQVIKLNDAVTAAKKALNGEERLNNRKAEALQRLDQLTHLNNAQRELAIQQINNAETLNKASRAINRATKLDNAMGAVQQYIDEQHLGVIRAAQITSMQMTI